MNKSVIYNHIIKTLGDKIKALQATIESAKESRDSDTKSSAGDKYETARAMVQIEIEKAQNQLSQTLIQKKEFSRIDVNKKYEKAQFGSLIETSVGYFFISIGFGKIEVENKSYFCISLASPIGKQLQNKKSGDTFLFQTNSITILSIV